MIDAHTSRLRCAVMLAVGLVAIPGGRARADDGPTRVLVIPLSGSIPDVPDSGDRITRVVARASGLTGAEVTVGDVSFEDAAALAGCAERTPDCFARVAATLQVDELVLGTISTSPDGARVIVSLTLFDQGEVRDRELQFPAGDMEAIVDGVARDVPRLFVGGDPEPEPEPEPQPEPQPEPEPQPLPIPPAPRDDGFSFGRVAWSSWLVAGSGVALAGTGVAFVLIGKDRQDQIDRAPIRDVDDFERLVELEDEGDRYLEVGSGLLIGGSALVVAGTVLIWLDGRGDAERPAPTVSVTPVPVAGNGAGLSLTVRLP